ncbi:MAG: rhamnulokinase family protein [Anaerovoracaceae bacterium]
MKYYLAIDIGASSGRHIVGWSEGGERKTKEVYRFPNGMVRKDGCLTWDTNHLVFHVKKGIDAAIAACGSVESLAIDTWGVDYVLLQNGKEIGPCYAYRDSRTEDVIPLVHEKIPFLELYRRTGIQFQPFNTIYQLSADKAAGRLDQADDLLMMPEYLLWKLCGEKSREYTNGTTTGLVSAETGEYDSYLLETLGYPAKLFPKLQKPGDVIGTYRGIRCMLCATHDTASAVEGIPMAENQPYISSGTWSLLGVKTPKSAATSEAMIGNWTNEGGVGYYRFQKNIMGLWLVQELRRELCPEKSFGQIMEEAEQSRFGGRIRAEEDAFLAPVSMKDAFDENLAEKPETEADYFRCAFLSLADSYGRALQELEENTGRTYNGLYIVGGGAKNTFLNRLTEAATGKKVMALPIEATALGNLKLQMKRKEKR